MAKSKMCPRCIAELLINAMNAVRVEWEEGDREALEEVVPGRGHYFEGHFRPRAEDVVVLDLAVSLGRRIILNGNMCVVMVSTWNGDPICSQHLVELYQRELNPTTVRMAQWRP